MRIAATKPRRRFATVAILSLFALPLAATGCGEDDETTAASTTTEAGASAGGDTVDISELDFELDPSTASAKAGTVTFAVSNDGDTTHNLEVEGNGVEEELPEDLAPGDSGDLTVDLAAGSYTMYCPVADHRDLGMEGTIEVE